MIVLFLLGEVLLFLGGLLLGHAILGALFAAAIVYAVLAYRHPNVAWILVWLAFPFSIERVIPGGHALHLPTEPMIALALLAWMARLSVDRPIRLPRAGLHLPLAALALVTLLSVLAGPFPELGIKGLIAATGYVLFAYVYCLLNCRDPGTVERSFPWIVGSAAVWGLYGTARILYQGFTMPHAYGLARPFFTEHGAYAAYLAMMLPLAVLCMMERKGAARAWYGVAALAIGLGLGLSLTRAAWVSIALVLPPTVALWASWRRSLKPIPWIAAIAGIVAIVLVGMGAGQRISRHASSISSSGDVSNLERFNRWMAAVEMVRARPLTGVGYAAYPHVYMQYRRKLILTDMAYVHSGAHSEVFRLLAESGIPGFAAALWLIGATLALGFRVFLRSVDPRSKLVALAILGGLGTYFVHGLFRTYIDLEKVAVPFWASLGVLAALAMNLDQPDRRGV
ncbi:MAG TPA: O-antigen ligase family protein [Candidatus Saccharimonadales bacterium]|nr:O-antigen ligase family protein [Candidatus Saccharimonadales bacterium]